jgi:hypothetical protein
MDGKPKYRIMGRPVCVATFRFVLGSGNEGTYSDITIEISKSEKSNLSRGKNIELDDERILRRIEQEFENAWIKGYQKEGIYFDIKIINVGIDHSGRKYFVGHSVDGVMRIALPQLGITPPPLKTL